MNLNQIKKIKECFPHKNFYLDNYINLLSRIKNIKNENTTKFYIVPKTFYQLHNYPIDNSENNVVYVSYSVELKLYLLLLYYFQSVDMYEEYKRIKNRLSRKVAKVGYGNLTELIKNTGDFPKEFYNKYQIYYQEINKIL